MRVFTEQTNYLISMKLLQGKTAIITGGSRGIGKAIVEVFAQHGANVAFTYSSSEEAANALAEEISKTGVKAKAYKSNAASYDEAQQLGEEVLKEFGSIDILINNAGITKDNLLMRMSEQDFDQVIEVNLKSVFNMTKAVQRTMLKQRKGSIINMSSVVGVMTASLPEETIKDFRNGIPLKRGGAPEDIANACVFLASDLSGYITGQVLNVDGGMLT